MASTSPPPPPAEASGPPLLIFNSRDGVASWWRLLFFIACSLVGHAAMFYLFKVVTPTTTRRVPPQEEVMILRNNDPAAAALLRSLEDRSPAGLLFSAGGRSEPAMLPLPEYVPSFEHYRPAIRQDWTPPTAPLLLLAEGSRPTLPDLEKSHRASESPKKQVPPAPAQLQLVLPTALQQRGMQTPPRWPGDLAPPEEAIDPYQFQLAINADGTIRYCLSDGMSPPAGLVKAVSQIRFNPQPRDPLAWAEVEVRW